jgi:hypothetical protein
MRHDGHYVQISGAAILPVFAGCAKPYNRTFDLAFASNGVFEHLSWVLCPTCMCKPFYSTDHFFRENSLGTVVPAESSFTGTSPCPN